jgi:uncharacterized protein (UPF0276 family)
MSNAKALIAQHHTGFGLGLRTPHYGDFLSQPQPVDWLEIITDNYLVEGGRPLVVLDQIRRDYPMAMHGVAMSIGAAGALDLHYLAQVKRLADRVQPLWVSDHLCWIGAGPTQLHDLYPLPYTDETARHVIAKIRQAQDVLQRRLVIENVSSYIDYQASSRSEWEFLSHIANEADCLLLVDVNNIYVSSVNHGFDPLVFLQGLPAHRVQQIHLAGHSDLGDHIIDTHDHPVADAVWDLYAQARRLFGPVAAMIERDADIPPLATLLTELDHARQIAIQADAQAQLPPSPISVNTHTNAEVQPSLAQTQTVLSDYILAPLPTAQTETFPARALVKERAGVDAARRLGIYHHAYRARLNEVLADSFAKTCLFMGSDLFDEEAVAFAVANPPTERSLNRYGHHFPDHLAARYPDNPELLELARLDWDLRHCFDGPDAPAFSAADAQADTSGQWLARPAPLHHSLRLRPIQTNVVQVWRAIDADTDVPPIELLEKPATLVVWRKGLQPHFQTVDAPQALFLQRLMEGASITASCEQLSEVIALEDPQHLAQWLQAWLQEAWLAVPPKRAMQMHGKAA